MYKFLLIFSVAFLSGQQKCKLFFENSNSLSKEGSIIFTIKNSDDKKAKVPKQYPVDFVNIIDIQIYNEDIESYERSRYRFSNATCLKAKDCFGKMVCLKKGESKEYIVQIIPGRISRAFKEKKKYRFKLAFDTYLFSGCNDYITAWLYYDNTEY